MYLEYPADRLGSKPARSWQCSRFASLALRIGCISQSNFMIDFSIEQGNLHLNLAGSFSLFSLIAPAILDQHSVSKPANIDLWFPPFLTIITPKFHWESFGWTSLSFYWPPGAAHMYSSASEIEHQPKSYLSASYISYLSNFANQRSARLLDFWFDLTLSQYQFVLTVSTYIHYAYSKWICSHSSKALWCLPPVTVHR